MTPDFDPRKIQKEMLLRLSELGELAWEDKVELAKLGSTIIEGGFLRTELIQAKSIRAAHLNVDDLSAISGQFSRLMAGVPDGARLEMGQKNGQPFLNMYDAGELRIEVLQDRINFYSEGAQQAYIQAYERNSGGYFRDPGVEIVSVNEMYFHAGNYPDDEGRGERAVIDLLGQGEINMHVASNADYYAWLGFKALAERNLLTIGGFSPDFGVDLDVFLWLSELYVVDTNFNYWRGRTETFTVSTPSGNKTLRFVNGIYVRSA